MTRIRLRPLEQTDLQLQPAPATLTARPSYPYYVDDDAVIVPTSTRWTFAPDEEHPVVELTEPIGYAWQLELRYRSGFTWLRHVVFVGSELDWDDLTDVDPSTLAQLPDRVDTPTGKTLITRDEALARIADIEGGAAGAGGLDFTLLFENGLI